MVMVWDGTIYFCTTNNIEGQTNTISKTHGQKPNPFALPFKKFGYQWPRWDRIGKKLEEFEVLRDNHRK